MKIIKLNAEQALRETIKTFQYTHPTHRCLYLRLSALSLNIQDDITAFMQGLNEILEDLNCEIYICDDYDVFIISRTITQKRTNEFLAPLFPKLWPAPAQGLASLFEIGISARQILNLCDSKLNEIAHIDDESLNFIAAHDAVTTLLNSPLEAA